ncbi:MAG: DNA polymerase beta domain-containing protein region, partial [Gemmatimonadetes bacterium]|nr:DNA polymerase beta domain-containing protein region [Gemmatimonadota bacterium]
PDHWAIVRDALRRHVPDREVLAFGSRATWTAKDYSDLDLAIMGEEPLSLRASSALDEALVDSDLPFRVDIVDWARIDDSFREIIRRNGVVLQGWGQRPEADGCETTTPGRSEKLAEWTRTTLGELLSFSNGKSSPDRSDLLPHPVYGSNGVIGFADKSNAGPSTIIIGRVGTYCGSLHYSDSACWVTDNAIRASAIGRNKPSFLRYLLRTLRLNARRTGSGQPLLNQTILSEIPVVVPNPPEQRAIAHVLGTLDDKIELNRRMNETLEAMARALFKSWFVDFDPVRAKMEGRDTGLPQDIADLFPDRLVDSEVGEIAEGWEAKSLKDCMNLTMGQSPPGSTYNDHGDGLPFFQGRAEFGFRYPEKRRFCSAPTRVANPDDTLVSVRAPVGDINLAWERCCIGRGVAALRHKSGSSSFTYHSAWALQRELKEYEHTGTVFGAINKGQFQALTVTEPDPRVVEAFDAMSVNLDARIRSNTAASRTLAGLRDTLLPKLISGEIRVPATDRGPTQ